MFQDLDSTLAAALNDPAMPAALVNLRNADKSFVTPDKNFAPALATVDLFLYEARENLQLREAAPVLSVVGSTYLQRPPPLRVDCCYLVTAWSPQQGAVGVAEAHRLLADALLWLSRFPTIPSRFLQGNLVNQPYPPPTLVAQLNGQKNLGEFWFALGIPPRPAFHLTVTVAMDLLTQLSGPIVTTTLTEHLQIDQAGASELFAQIGGTVVRGAPPRPVSGGGAFVLSVDLTGLQVRVDEPGPFRVGDLVARGPLDRARINAIAGSVLTLNMALQGLATGDILKVSRPPTSVQLENPAGTRLQSTVTDAASRFLFMQLKPGNYQLRAQAVGLGEILRPIVVPSPTGEYDVQFP